MEQVADHNGSTRLTCAVLGALCVTAIGLVGARMFAHVPLWFTFVPIAGLVAALACRRWPEAAIAAGVGVYGGVAASLLSTTPLAVSPQSWAGVVLPGAVIAAAVAAAAAFAIERSPRAASPFAAAAIVVLLGTMWFAQYQIAYTPLPGGLTPVAAFTGTPTVGPRVSDDALYLLMVKRVAAGENYYAVTLDLLRQSNASGRGLVDPRSAIAYRLPTLYRLYASLPQDGISFVYAFLVIASAGTLAAYALARRFVVAPVALVGATLVADYLSSHSSWLHLFQTEIWAGALGLVSVACFVESRGPKRSRELPLQIAAVAAAVAAAAFRELAVPFLLVGLVAVLADKELRSRRLWIPWVVGIGAVAVGYGLHVSAVRSAVQGVTFAEKIPAFVWFDPTGRGLYAAVFLVAEFLALPVVFAWALTALGVAGSLLASRDRATRIELAAIVVGGCVALFFLHPSGESGAGIPPGYWGGVVMPTLLACVPLAFALLPGVRRTRAGNANGAAPEGTAPLEGSAKATGPVGDPAA